MFEANAFPHFILCDHFSKSRLAFVFEIYVGNLKIRKGTAISGGCCVAVALHVEIF